MKLLFICNDLDYFLAHRSNLLHWALSNDWDVCLCAGGKISDKSRKSIHPEVRFVEIPVHRHRLAPLSDFVLLMKIRKEIISFQPDLVHSITIKPNIFTGLAILFARFSKLPQKPSHVATFPGLGRIFENQTGIWKRLRKSIVAKALQTGFVRNKTVCTFENPEDAETISTLTKIPNERSIVTMGAGIDFDTYKPGKKFGVPKVLFASRLLKSKGAEVFLRGAKLALKTDPALQISLAGQPDAGNSDSIEQETLNAENAAGNIKLLGFVEPSQMPKLLAETDIVVLPTMLQEGLPRSLLEAAACGCALIASDQASIRQIMIDEKSGWLLNEISAEEVAARILAAAKDIKATRKMGEFGQKHVRSLPVSNQAVMAKFNQAYEIALRQKINYAPKV